MPLKPEEYARNFCDIHPPLTHQQAAFESSRCYFCHDAPCIQACPTKIDIPTFIRGIQTGNRKGAATEILSANILGGTCARACPVEILCEESCVRNTAETKPVTIGLLQRHATDWLFEKGIQPFSRAPLTGRKIAVVGAGPAGLSCAHRLSMLGNDVEIFEALPKAGGLNEYGLAAYKMTGDFAQREVDFVLSLGGIQIHSGQALGREVKLADLRTKFDAVFLGVGLAGVNALQVEGEKTPGVEDAVKFIAELRQAKDPARVTTARRVVVIGGGNTAIDAAIQSRRLGAEEVTLIYRRGPEQMSATKYEQELAQKNSVVIRHWMKPLSIEKTADGLRLHLEKTQLGAGGKLTGTGVKSVIETDLLYKAIGQIFLPNSLGNGAESLELESGKIKVDSNMQTTIPGVYAGGDMVNEGEDLTVVAVEQGKVAAIAIDRWLREKFDAGTTSQKAGGKNG